MAVRIVSVVWEPGCAHSVWHRQIFQGLQKAAPAAQCSVQLADTDSEALTDPVILIGNSHESLMTAVAVLSRRGKRIILAGMDADSLSSQISCVTHSRSQQMIRMLCYMADCGRQHIALVGVGQMSLNDMVKVDAALRYTSLSQHPIREEDVFRWAGKIQECTEAFLRVWRRYDAVICPNDYAAFVLIRQLLSAGVRVPEDLYVAGFSDQTIDRYCTPSITSITMDYWAIGRYAFSIWQQLQTLTEPELVCKLVAPGRLIVRGSTGWEPCRLSEGAPALWTAPKEKEQFYHDPTIRRLMQIETCLSNRDDLDIRIIEGLLSGLSYEALCDRLYISLSSLHYRTGKIYRELGCRTRAEFTELFRTCYGTFTLSSEN